MLDTLLVARTQVRDGFLAEREWWGEEEQGSRIKCAREFCFYEKIFIWQKF
jgi:hypothetical protein